MSHRFIEHIVFFTRTSWGYVGNWREFVTGYPRALIKFMWLSRHDIKGYKS